MESAPAIASFTARWSGSGAAERANYQLFLSELCDLLGVPRPDPTKPDDADNAYVFERNVTFHHPDGSTSTGRIDLYKRGCYVLEAKQGVEKREAAEALADATKAKAKSAKKGHAQRGSAAWDEAMLKARGQAEQYARALPASEGRPPLLIVVDVGHSLELYAEFTRTGGTYVPFPDPQSHRLSLEKLHDPAVRETLRLAWTDPQALDPARRSARVTREIAQSLGRLAASLEKSGHSAEAVATFLMRALFTMFAEDVELLPKDSFVNLLKSLHGHTDQFVPMIEELWGRMQTGGFSTVLREKVRHFNGGLFEHATALPLTDDQFELLIEASRADWRDVEPAIFGTLLERALNPIERHKLGAHYTPRAYVERLVLPTVVEPLRAEWDAAKAAAVTLDRQGKTKEAAAEVQRFHRRLCEVRVLDPACGSGNFLYVTLEHLKRLEGEVFNALDRLGHEQAALEMAGFTVDPHQLLGLEVNPRAAAIAELVLWIGYLQWHFRTRGRVAPPEPIIKNFRNIQCRDAVLAWDGDPVPLVRGGHRAVDAEAPPLEGTAPSVPGRTSGHGSDGALPSKSGEIVTRWDGRTMKKHPVTGEDVPDETARVPLLNYVNPRPADWPQADFIVGNPPFIGTARMRDALGDGYTEAVRETYPDVPESADFVMYWWEKAARLVRAGVVRRFGFITTNSLRQTFNRRVVERHLSGAPSSPEPRTPMSATPSSPEGLRKLAGGVSHRSARENESAPAGAAESSSAPAGAHPTDTDDRWLTPPANIRQPSGLQDAARTPAEPLSLVFAIPDHPWVDAADGAAVRIAMTVAVAGEGNGRLVEVVAETESGEDAANVTLTERTGLLHANLAIGANVGATVPLEANAELSCPGVKLHGAGFIVTREEAAQLGLGRIAGTERHIREYRNGKDLTAKPRGVMVIDLFGLTADEVRDRYPEVFQWVHDHVKPERDANNRATYRDNWWVFGEPRGSFRPALAGLPRYMATVETAKHRIFQFLDGSVLPDNKLIAIALDDAFFHGVLSSRIHGVYALAAGSWLGVGNDPVYVKTRCFETFPFPTATEAQQTHIRDLAERLDTHRKRQQAQHPKLTLTDMYNVLEKLRVASALRADPAAPAAGPSAHRADATAAATLTAKEREIHEQGLVTVLRQLHDDLDAAVAAAYGFPHVLPDAEILTHLCALNAQRAAEERTGTIRWLRPAFQNPNRPATQAALAGEGMDGAEGTKAPATAKAAAKLAWPKSFAEQALAVRTALTAFAAPADAAMLAATFKSAKADRIADLLETLASLGQARALAGGRFVAG